MKLVKMQKEIIIRPAGIAINDNFQIFDEFGGYNRRIFMMAVPYIGGFNPDYSGLDFCEAASARIVKTILDLSPRISTDI